MITVKNLKKNFGDLTVLKGIDVTIEKGECVVVIGPSGSGKSTFLRCLNRLEEPDGGEIDIEGTDLLHTRTSMRCASGLEWYFSILICFLTKPFWKM